VNFRAGARHQSQKGFGGVFCTKQKTKKILGILGDFGVFPPPNSVNFRAGARQKTQESFGGISASNRRPIFFEYLR
jgi:hypothetical protein